MHAMIDSLHRKKILYSGCDHLKISLHVMYVHVMLVGGADLDDSVQPLCQLLTFLMCTAHKIPEMPDVHVQFWFVFRIS